MELRPSPPGWELEGEEAPWRVSWSRCSTRPLSCAEAQVGVWPTWGSERRGLAGRTPLRVPHPGTGRACSRAAGLLGPVGRARCSHTLRTLPGRARRRRRRLLLPGSRRGGAEGERGCAERAGRGLSAVGGSEGASERASERAGHFCAAPERLGARPGGHWTRGPRDRQTDGSRKPRRRRQVSRARRPRRLSLRPEPRVLEDVRGRSRSYDSCLCWYVCRGSTSPGVC